MGAIKTSLDPGGYKLQIGPVAKENFFKRIMRMRILRTKVYKLLIHSKLKHIYISPPLVKHKTDFPPLNFTTYLFLISFLIKYLKPLYVETMI